jgi:preprotein translocase subunit SecY
LRGERRLPPRWPFATLGSPIYPRQSLPAQESEGPGTDGQPWCRQLTTMNSAAVLPVVVAPWPLSILLLIAYIADSDGSGWLSSIVEQLGRGQPGFILYIGIAIVVFALFYVALLIDPDAVAEKLKRWRGVIPGIDPGAATADHIDQVLSRTTILGAVYLALVCLVPEILIAYARIPIYLGGVPVLIVVCTVLDIHHQEQDRKHIKNREERHQWG